MIKSEIVRVLFIDRAYPLMAQYVRRFADSVQRSNIYIIFLTDKEPSGVNGNFEIINIFDVPQRRSLEDLQATFSFSLHKTLVPERSFYDYSSFRRSQCYSRLSEEQIAERFAPYVNAFDFVIREKVDLILDGSADCFIPSLAGRIASHYMKPFRMFFLYYWWQDGMLFVDRMDQTSSEVDRNYQYYYDNPMLCDHQKLDEVFAEKKSTFQFADTISYPLLMRVRQVLNKQKSFDPPSLKNWLIRRVGRVWSKALILAIIRRELIPHDDFFVLFPLHVTPESSLLGSTPELADQFGLIKNISMNLPYGVKLYVKEHPHAEFGLGLDYYFYRRLTALPNVRIIRGNARLERFLEHPQCLAVAVINGTLALDAVMKRKPVFVFGRAYYGVADCFLKPSNFEEFCSQLLSIQRGEFKFNERALYAILKALDTSIVRADVNFQACRSIAELVMTCIPAICRSYVESLEWKMKPITVNQSDEY